jgi:hypothetical protein
MCVLTGRTSAEPGLSARVTYSSTVPYRERMILTVGHSTRSLDEFLELLRAHAMAQVVDVRRYPASRRHPHFAGEALACALERAGIGYRHEADLGGRRQARRDSPNTAWRSAGFRGYADHMDTPEFRTALDRVIEAGRAQTVAIMCAEAVPWRCHRQLIADAIVGRGVAVGHILGPARVEPHHLAPHARVDASGRVTYPGATRWGRWTCSRLDQRYVTCRRLKRRRVAVTAMPAASKPSVAAPPSRGAPSGTSGSMVRCQRRVQSPIGSPNAVRKAWSTDCSERQNRRNRSGPSLVTRSERNSSAPARLRRCHQ